METLSTAMAAMPTASWNPSAAMVPWMPVKSAMMETMLTVMAVMPTAMTRVFLQFSLGLLVQLV